MRINVESPGIYTTVQDRGRFGSLADGIGQSGVMDTDAYSKANILAGNSENAAVLECTYTGPVLTFTSECLMAITGADMNPKIDGAPVKNYEKLNVKAGSVLDMSDAAGKGIRSYIAFHGGINVPMVLGSRSTDIKAHLGGIEGRALKSGDVLETGTDFVEEESKESFSPAVFERDIAVHVVPGPQEEYFTEKGINDFYSHTYSVTDKSDRMGLRLDGIEIETLNGSDIVSDGIVFGSIQIPGNGKPVIMMADHQTTGGYAKIATVCSFDLPLLGQARPGSTVRFIRTSIEDAEKMYFDPKLRETVIIPVRHEKKRFKERHGWKR